MNNPIINAEQVTGYNSIIGPGGSMSYHDHCAEDWKYVNAVKNDDECFFQGATEQAYLQELAQRGRTRLWHIPM
jgi:hypothetical protein